MQKLNFFLTVLILLGVISTIHAQQKVTEKDLIGTWKMVIDIDEEMEEAKREAAEENNIFGQMVLSSVSGLVEGILENIDINFDFRRNGVLEIFVDAIGEEESDIIRWEINANGELIIIGDSEKIQLDSDGDSYWLLKGNRLLLYEDGELEENVYLIKYE